MARKITMIWCINARFIVLHADGDGKQLLHFSFMDSNLSCRSTPLEHLLYHTSKTTGSIEPIDCHRTQTALLRAQNVKCLSLLTCITRIGKPVSLANCSRMCLVGFGVWLNAFFNTSNCLALIVVRGPRRFDPFAPSSGLLFSACESPRQSGSPSIEPCSSAK